MIEQLAGEKLDPGAEIDPQDFVDRQFDVTVDRDGRLAVIKPLSTAVKS